MTDALRLARALVRDHARAAAFTGAGVSTASGVPDFRSPGGLWSRYTPVPFDAFLTDASERRRYWRYKRETYDAFARALPNPAHLSLADLESAGRLAGVITQNIDGLHQAAGSRRVIELHGTNRFVGCLECHRRFPADQIHHRLSAGEEDPRCDTCGGLLKPATVSFGQQLPRHVVDDAFALATSVELLLVLGSSLVVHPAAAIPDAAADAGARLVVINDEPTPVDGRADVVLRGPVEELLPQVVAGVTQRPLAREVPE
jgi:NAD-dependent deacetylase